MNTKKKILLIDKGFSGVDELTAVIQKTGYDLIRAADTLKGIELAETELPNLIIAGIHSFNHKKDNTISLINSTNFLRHTPAVFFGEIPEKKAKINNDILFGAREYIQIPFEPLKFAAVIARLLEYGRMCKILRNKDFRFHSFIENSTDIITVLLPNGTILYESPSAKQILGREPQTDKGTNAFEFIHPHDCRWVVAHFKKTVPNPSSSNSIEYRFQHHDGSWRILESVGKLVEDPTRGKVVVINSRDVTKRKDAERLLRENERKFRAQYMGFPIPTYTYRKTSEDFVLIDYNDAAKKATDDKIKNFVGRQLHTIYSYSSDVYKKIARCFNEQIIINDVNYYQLRTTGQWCWLDISYIFVPPDLVMVHARDITDSHQAAKEMTLLNRQIENQQQRLNAVIDNLPGVVWEARLDSESDENYLIFISVYAEQLLGYTIEEWMSTPDFWFQIIHPDDLERIKWDTGEFIKNAGSDLICECRWIAKDGRTVWTETKAHLITDKSGNPASLRCISIDITEQKIVEQALQKSEEQLRQSQKLESVGRLAGGIAHDFNNMLTAINGYSDLILREIGNHDPLSSKVLEIKKAGERSAALTHQLLAFSRRQVLQPKLIDLNNVVTEMNQMLLRLIGEDIQLNIMLNEHKSCVEADLGQLSQVVLNLVVNARDAMPQGGDLSIQTSSVLLENEPVAQFASGRTGQFIMLAVADNGIGIENKTLEKIFEPFFTTKAVGVGTGLGLSTAYGIVKQSGGFIWVDSVVGKGTTFRVYLPYIEEQKREGTERKAVEQFPRGTETILLVEDEDAVRNLTCQILELCGYTVLEAGNGIEALKICEETDCRIDLLMTDIVMPQMGGRELAKKITDKNSDIKILFTSGYTNDRTLITDVSEPATNFIQKPFAPDVLARCVRKLLDSKIE